MSPTKLKKRLRDAQRIWQKEIQNPDIQGMPGYMPGILRGFTETIRIVQQYQSEELNKAVSERRPLSRWSALQLYRACERAHGRLRYSDRTGAIRILKRALADVTLSKRRGIR